MAALIMKITRDNIEWEDEPYFGVQTPKKVEEVEMTRFDIAKFYS